MTTADYTSKRVELKSCPFCGSNDIDPEGWLNSVGITGPACNNCNASAGEVSKSSADNIVAWNTRTDSVPLPEESELVEKLARVIAHDDGGEDYACLEWPKYTEAAQAALTILKPLLAAKEARIEELTEALEDMADPKKAGTDAVWNKARHVLAKGQ